VISVRQKVIDLRAFPFRTDTRVRIRATTIAQSQA
jgi:hypothetical protein